MLTGTDVRQQHAYHDDRVEVLGQAGASVESGRASCFRRRTRIMVPPRNGGLSHMSKPAHKRAVDEEGDTEPQTLPHPERGRIGGGRCRSRLLRGQLPEVERTPAKRCRALQGRHLANNSWAFRGGTDPHLSSPFQGEEAFVAWSCFFFEDLVCVRAYSNAIALPPGGRGPSRFRVSASTSHAPL